MHAQADHEPDQGQQDQRREQALDVEADLVEGLSLSDDGQVADDGCIAVDEVNAGGGGVAVLTGCEVAAVLLLVLLAVPGLQVDRGNKAGIGERRQLKQRMNKTDKVQLCFVGGHHVRRQHFHMATEQSSIHLADNGTGVPGGGGDIRTGGTAFLL